jgi:ssDNA-binding Zn-finger/Zn-ribbon topoisomerase 1
MTLGFVNEGLVVWLLLTVTVLPILTWAYILLRRHNSYDFPVQARSRLLSPTEKNFFEYLADSLSDDFFIFTKVTILDVVEVSPKASKGWGRVIQNRLKTQCFDFILCKKHDLSIVGIVALENHHPNDSSDNAIRKKLITGICKSAHLKVFHFDVRQDYHRLDVRRLVTGKSSKAGNNNLGPATTQNPQFTIDNSSYKAFARGRRCPQCNGEVVTKVALKGKAITEKILMCRKYPYCDYQVAMNDKDVMQKMHKNSLVEQEQANSESDTH